MLKYRVRSEYLDGWTSKAVDMLIVDECEIHRRSREWGISVDTLMMEVEEWNG